MLDGRVAAAALGAVTGLIGLIAMVRLVAVPFGDSLFAWVFVLAAMVPWVGYAAWRGGRARLGRRARLTILILIVAGLVAAVWLFTLGPVIALVCSLAAFGVIWVNDRPPRPPRGEGRFVRISEFGADDGQLR